MIGFDAASVSDLVGSVKALLEEEFQEVMVQGEVSNLSLSGAGHWYFSLSDENASISCALFKGDAIRNPLIRNLKDGDKIVIVGPLSVYAKRGSFQLLAKRVFPAGEGQLKLQFERLKARLSEEGLFDLEKKKKIPHFPKRIAVITAEHGAALQDFLNVISRRSLWMDLLIIPALVQGENSPKSLISAINKASGIDNVDVIVITRGGGSLEDLWAFNDENLVRSIFECKIPVVSAVGHQVDFTLCDYVSDYRCETPTAAAELLSQSQTELSARMIYCKSHLKSNLFKIQQQVQIMVYKFHPKEMLNLIKMKVRDGERRLLQIHLMDRTSELIGLPEMNQRVDESVTKLSQVMISNLKGFSDNIASLHHLLNVLNPHNVLNRGYSFIKDDEGRTITNAKLFDLIPSKSKLEISFNDGQRKVLKD